MQRLSITCPYCDHTDPNWPAEAFPQGQHEHACMMCLAQFLTTRDGDTVTTRRFLPSERPEFPRPSRRHGGGLTQ